MKSSITAFLALILSAAAAAQERQPESENRELYAPSAWDLEIGNHASELDTDQFAEFACGTNGGPPSLPLDDWTGYDQCRPEAASGLREVYFEYDDELELWAKASSLDLQSAIYEYTSAYAIPIIVSVLFNADGFMVGLRILSDPRVPVVLREQGATLGGFLTARYGVEGWDCIDLEQLEGEHPFLGFFQKSRCEKTADDNGLFVTLETHNYRKPGQNFLNPANQLTEGEFRSETRLEVTLIGPIENAEERLAAIEARAVEPSEKELRIERALDCAGCDFAGADFKRSDLTGANLAGANLAGANLHAAILRGVNLSGANLAGANLNGADARLSNFAGADLSEAMMYSAAFDGADLTEANLSGALAGRVTMPRASLDRVLAHGADFIEARINDAHFVDADLRGSRFDDAQMTRSDFTGALLNQSLMRRVNLRYAILAGADVRAADLQWADLRDTDLSNANFSQSWLTYAYLSRAVLEGSIWTDALLPSGFEPP